MKGRLVVVGVSRAGGVLAGRIARGLPDAEIRVHTAQEPVGMLLLRLFRDPSVGGLVVVLAVGATVRLLAPWLRGKTVDPAVVAVDDAGRFAVALVAGHRGGANALAHQVAAAIGACPVVTTASDVGGLPAIDLLGAEQGWRIEATPETLRQAAAAVVNRLPVGLYQDAGEPLDLFPADGQLLNRSPSNQPSLERAEPGAWPGDIRPVVDLDDPGSVAELAALLVVSDRCVPHLVSCQVVYRPPTLVVGVGCSRGASGTDVLAAIELALRQGGLARGSLALLATIDRRLDEPGVVAAAEALGLPLRGFSAQALAQVDGLANPSERVRAAVGTPGVCEPAARLASGATRLVVPKVKTATATAAIARFPTAFEALSGGPGARKTRPPRSAEDERASGAFVRRTVAEGADSDARRTKPAEGAGEPIREDAVD